MKILLMLSAILLAAMGVHAQNNRHPNLVSYASTPPARGRTERPNDSAPLKPEYMNSINISAVRDFVKRFKEPNNARWYKMEGGSFLVKFEQPDISWRVMYTSGGNWIYTIQTYHEKQLARDVRGIVKSKYYDYSITQVEEIEHVEGVATVYIVHLKDDTSWKTVRVCQGEMDEMETLYKR